MSDWTRVKNRLDGRPHVPRVSASDLIITTLYILGDGGTYFQIGIEETGDPSITFTDVGSTRPATGIVVEN